jgi:hypothetical protein
LGTSWESFLQPVLFMATLAIKNLNSRSNF